MFNEFWCSTNSRASDIQEFVWKAFFYDFYLEVHTVSARIQPQSLIQPHLFQKSCFWGFSWIEPHFLVKKSTFWGIFWIEPHPKTHFEKYNPVVIIKRIGYAFTLNHKSLLLLLSKAFGTVIFKLSKCKSMNQCYHRWRSQSTQKLSKV